MNFGGKELDLSEESVMLSELGVSTGSVVEVLPDAKPSSTRGASEL